MGLKDAKFLLTMQVTRFNQALTKILNISEFKSAFLGKFFAKFGFQKSIKIEIRGSPHINSLDDISIEKVEQYSDQERHINVPENIERLFPDILQFITEKLTEFQIYDVEANRDYKRKLSKYIDPINDPKNWENPLFLFHNYILNSASKELPVFYKILFPERIDAISSSMINQKIGSDSQGIVDALKSISKLAYQKNEKSRNMPFIKFYKIFLNHLYYELNDFYETPFGVNVWERFFSGVHASQEGIMKNMVETFK